MVPVPPVIESLQTKQGSRGNVFGVVSTLQLAQPSVQWIPGPGVLLKRPGHEVDLLAPSNVEVKNEWSYTSTPLLCLHDNFNFLNTKYFIVQLMHSII